MRKSNVWAAVCMMLVISLFACRDEGSSNPTPPAPPAPTYSIAGTVTLSGAGLFGVTMTLDGNVTVTTDASGSFTFSGLTNGSYSIVPSRLGYKFSPATLSLTISGASISGQTFTSTAIASTPFKMRGFNITAWYPGGWSDSLPIDLAVQFAKDEGANMIAMDWAVNFNDDGTIVSQIGGPSHPIWQDILSLIAKVKAAGFYLVLKPHVTLAAGASNRNSWNTDVATFLPSNFFPAWQLYLNNLAAIASARGVDAICIGTENNHIDWQFKDDWAALIKSLRSNFSGALTYDALFVHWKSYKDIKDVVFWDLLDFIACSFYVVLTQDDSASVDTLRQLFTNNPFGDYRDPIGQLRSISEKYGKQLITLEGGYQSCNGGLWDLFTGANNNKIVNNDLQARGLDAYMWALNVNKQDWLKGCSIWDIMPSLMGTQNISNIQGFEIYGKPSAGVVKRWYTLQ